MVGSSPSAISPHRDRCSPSSLKLCVEELFDIRSVHPAIPLGSSSSVEIRPFPLHQGNYSHILYSASSQRTQQALAQGADVNRLL